MRNRVRIQIQIPNCFTGHFDSPRIMPTSTVYSTQNSDRLHVASVATIGNRSTYPYNRPHQQDRHKIKLDDHDGTIDFMGVYDGHGINGGPFAWNVSVQLLWTVLRKVKTGIDMEEAIRQSHIEIDAQTRLQSWVYLPRAGGSTAASVWIKDGFLYSANVGDAKVILSVDGVGTTLTTVHRPGVRGEKARIVQAGGYVCCNAINGGTMVVSRAFGDYWYKNAKLPAEKQMISVVPAVRKMPLPENFDFILLATNGLFDYLSDEEVVSFVQKEIDKGERPSEICSKILKRMRKRWCKYFFGGMDNVTVIIAVPHRKEKCTGCPVTND